MLDSHEHLSDSVSSDHTSISTRHPVSTSSNQHSLELEAVDSKHAISQYNHSCFYRWVGYSWFDRWLQFCGYLDCHPVWIVFVTFLLIIASIIEYKAAMSNEYYAIDHVPEILWILSTIITYCTLQRNLNSYCCCFKKEGEQGLNNYKWKFRVYIFAFCVAMVITRWIIFIPHICPSSEERDHLYGAISAFFVNMVVMYTVNFVVFHRCLIIITKCNKLIQKLQDPEDNNQERSVEMSSTQNKYQIDLLNSRQKSVDEIQTERLRHDVFSITDDIKILKKKWQLAVSILYIYHLLYPVFYIISFWIYPTTHLWMYCYSDSWTQLFMIIIRSSVRLFALCYPFFMLNEMPDQLKKTINRYGSWDKSVSADIQRIKQHLETDVDSFRVVRCVQLKWKTLYGVGVWVIALILASFIPIFIELSN